MYRLFISHRYLVSCGDVQSVDPNSDWKEGGADKPKSRAILSRNNLPSPPYAPETVSLLPTRTQASSAMYCFPGDCPCRVGVSVGVGVTGRGPLGRLAGSQIRGASKHCFHTQPRYRLLNWAVAAHAPTILTQQHPPLPAWLPGGATSWGISSIFAASERGTGGKGSSMVASLYADALPAEHGPVSIHLREVWKRTPTRIDSRE